MSDHVKISANYEFTKYETEILFVTPQNYTFYITGPY